MAVDSNPVSKKSNLLFICGKRFRRIGSVCSGSKASLDKNCFTLQAWSGETRKNCLEIAGISMEM
jgi:hypothetical protein